MPKIVCRPIHVLLCLAITFCACFFAVLTVAEAELLQKLDPLTYEIDSAFSGQLTHTIQVDNPNFDRIKGGMLFVPIIKNDTARHYVVIYNITSTAGNPEFLNDLSGNTYAYWDSIMIDSYQTFTARIQYYVLSFGTHIVIDSTRTTNYDRSTDLYKTFTQPEETVESDAPEIISEAKKLTQDVGNIHDKVSRIYDFVTSHLHYTREEHERGALWALENRSGDCSEYSYLFAALCRAAGIPARIQTGFGFRNLDEEALDGHMWTEYYLQGYGWIPVDPTWKLFDRMDQKHFSSMKGAPEITPYANYFFNYTQGPDNSNIRHTQEILLKPSSMNLFGDDLVGNTLKTVNVINQARFAMTIERLFGMPFIFQSEAAQVDQAYVTSEMSLQSALQNWTENPTTAQSYIFDTQTKAQEALRKAWMLVAYGFALFIGTLVALLAIASVLIGRRRTKPERRLSLARVTV